MSRPAKNRKDKRTTVSLAQVVWQMAEEMMEAKGFNENFSAYVADLVRRDKERHQPAEPKPSNLYSSSSTQEENSSDTKGQGATAPAKKPKAA